MNHLPFIILDTETTGLNPEKDQLIEIAAVLVENGEIQDRFETLLNPGIPLDPVVTALTGIQEKDLVQAPLIHTVIPALEKFLGKYPILGHNIAFDLEFLKQNKICVEEQFSLDTLILAQILLPEQVSFSLEGITANLEVEHLSHRAMGDVLACWELFKIFYQKLQELDPLVLSLARQGLERSEWEGGKFFFNLRSTNISAKPEELLAQIKTKLEQYRQEPDDLQANPTTSNTVEESPLQQFLLDPTEKELILETPYKNKLSAVIATIVAQLKPSQQLEIFAPAAELPWLTNLLEQQLSASGWSTFNLPADYFSWKSFAVFYQQTHFNLAESTLLLKVLPWLLRTQTGLRFELKLNKPEREAWQKISAVEIPKKVSASEFWQHCFYFFAQERLQKASVTLAAQNLLLEPHPHQIDNLKLISSFHKLGTTLTNLSRKDWSSLEFKQLLLTLNTELTGHCAIATTNQLELPFNLPYFSSQLKQALNILVELILQLETAIRKDFKHLIDNSNYRSQIRLTEMITGQDFWQATLNIFQQIFKTQQNFLNYWPDFKNGPQLPAIFKETVEKITQSLKLLNELLIDTGNHLLWLTFEPEDASFSLTSVWNDLPKFTQNIREKTSKIIWVDQVVEKTFLPELELEQVPQLTLGQPLWQQAKVKIYSNLPFPSSPGFNQVSLTQVTDLIEEKKGGVFVFLNAVSAVDLFKEKLFVQFNSTPTDKINLVAQISGSPHKIQQQFEQDPARAVVLGTTRFLEEVPLDGQFIHTLIVQKLPFENPFDPLLQSWSEKYGEKSFQEFLVPRAINRLKRVILTLLENQSEVLEIHFLDNRLLKQDYGKEFLAIFPKEVEIK